MTRIGSAHGETDRGRRRPHNEDTFVCDPPVFGVADGMGGHHSGEVASALAAAALVERGETPSEILPGEETVAHLVQEANERIYQAALTDPSVAGMGTTITVALIDEESDLIAIGHVGDSRAYRVRRGTLEQLTEDHSLVGELVRSGRLSADEAQRHPHRSVITRAAGTEPTVEIDTVSVDATDGDVFLLCSDGLTTMLSDAQILTIIERDGLDTKVAARSLIDAANAAGGEDNITVVLFTIGEPAANAAGPGAPDAATDEVAATATPPIQAVEDGRVRRHGAGRGGRALALLAIAAGIAIAAVIVWWSLQ